VTKTQSAGPISCLEHRATRVLHCAIVTRAAVLMFPLLLQTIISNQMRRQRLRGAWFSRLLRHPARRQSGSILSPGTHDWELLITKAVTVPLFPFPIPLDFEQVRSFDQKAFDKTPVTVGNSKKTMKQI